MNKNKQASKESLEAMSRRNKRNGRSKSDFRE